MKVDTKYIDPKKDVKIDDVDWCNFFYDFKKIFDGVKGAEVLNDNEIAMRDPEDLNIADDLKKPTFKLLKDGRVSVDKNNKYKFAVGSTISKFMLLSAIKFAGDHRAAISFISYTLRETEIPYIRVACDFFKVIDKDNRYGATSILLKKWAKIEIKDDHSKYIFRAIPHYDDFTIIPDNVHHFPSWKNCYNLYIPFPHKPAEVEVSEEELPTTMTLLNHIFGNQLDIGIKYMKILYQKPQQILPVLVLVSEERETGKTTFLNWIHMLFGENSILISPQDLTHQFNSSYATRNIIMIDETVIEKSTSVEKLKNLATAKSITINEKHVAHYSIPFFGKIIIATNKEKDFMRIDEQEIRFWIRKIKVINGHKNTSIENDLFSEIPAFLKYLAQQPEVDTSRSRMVFTLEELGTKELTDVKNESKSGLLKDVEILVEDFFNRNPSCREFYATLKEIKDEWFRHDNRISPSYLKKILHNEMKMLPAAKVKRYQPFNKENELGSVGRPYTFVNPEPKDFGPKDNGVDSSPVVDGGPVKEQWWDREREETGAPAF